MKGLRTETLVLAFLLASASALSAIEYKAVVPQLSPISTTAYQSLITAIVEATGNTVKTEVLPFARCLYMIETKQADIESIIVALPDPEKHADLKFDYSTADAVKIIFVLYTNPKKPIDVTELKKGNPKAYKIETDIAHVNHFSFAIAGSSSMDASLKKVDSGSIDGYIFSQASADAALRNLGLKNIVRTYFDTWTGKLLVVKGGAGGPIDKMISEGFAKIQASGKYQAIMGQLIAGASTFKDWQP